MRSRTRSNSRLPKDLEKILSARFVSDECGDRGRKTKHGLCDVLTFDRNAATGWYKFLENDRRFLEDERDETGGLDATRSEIEELLS